MQPQSAVISSLVNPASPDLLHVGEEASGGPAVHVIDDDDSFRRSILRILHALGYAAVGYGCAGEFLLTVRGEPVGCILLDISMPGPSGIDLLRGLMQRGSVSPTIFLTARDDIMTSVNAMKLGAFDYLVKPVTAERLSGVVERAMRLDAQRVAERHEFQRLCSRYARLTNSEHTIFVGVAAHRLNKQMAGDLGACERTIKALRARMMAKLNLTTVPEVVRAAAMLERAGVSPARAATAATAEAGERRPWNSSFLQALPASN